MRARYVGVFLVALFGSLAVFNAATPRVLVIHKDQRSGQWAVQVDAGIRRLLKENRRPVSVTWHYLDLVGRGLPAARVAAVSEARRAIARIDPDVIIAVDDETSHHLGRDWAGRERPKVIYVSIDLPPSRYGYDTVPNVSGIAEVLPLAAARDAVLALRGRRVAVVGSDSETTRAEMGQVTAFDWKPCSLVQTSLSRTLSEFQTSIERAGGAADVVLILTFSGLLGQDGTAVPDPVAAAWVEERSRAFPLGLRQEFVAGGGALALTPAGDDEGAAAMAMALDWLDRPWLTGAPAPTTSDAFNVMMRAGRLEQRGVKLPPIYREAARASGSLLP